MAFFCWKFLFKRPFVIAYDASWQCITEFLLTFCWHKTLGSSALTHTPDLLLDQIFYFVHFMIATHACVTSIFTCLLYYWLCRVYSQYLKLLLQPNFDWLTLLFMPISWCLIKYLTFYRLLEHFVVTVELFFFSTNFLFL